ncbi:hypothetical protein K474DRAFT_1662972 [Panus rudis PR-1116 ss-1]|nr:hypothetical protein K474DRAFT_1662972 [Panus rudis PR-1116 ss-1]
MSIVLTLNIDECDMRISVFRHSDDVITQFDLTVEHPDEGEVGSMTMHVIDRSRCRGSFLRVMERYSEELHVFSQTFFDKNGVLRPEFTENEFHKGSGVWGRELDEGQLVFIESIDVDERYQRLGIGTAMIRRFIESSWIRPPDVFFARPHVLDRRIEGSALAEQQVRLANIFFRNKGFRRVGRTDYLAYSANRGHPQHKLPASDDVEPNSRWARDESLPVHYLDNESSKKRANREAIAHARKYPVHHAIASSTEAMLNPPSKTSHRRKHVRPIEETLTRLYEKDPSCISAQDEHGTTPLHLAATLYNLPAIQSLLSVGGEPIKGDLIRRDNRYGTTPVEACEFSVRSWREYVETTLEQSWMGSPEDAMRCMYVLRKAAGEDVGDELAFLKTKRWCCSCGKCLEGWLSPKMRFRLMVQAGELFHLMDDSRPLVDQNSLLLKHAGHHQYESFRRVIAYINYVLVKDQIPFPSLILTFAQRAARKLNNNSSEKSSADQTDEIESALRLVLDWAKDQSILGNSHFENLICADPNGQLRKRWDALPRCENDLNFELVRKRLGVPEPEPEVQIVVQDEGEDADAEDSEDEKTLQGDCFSCTAKDASELLFDDEPEAADDDKKRTLLESMGLLEELTCFP